MTQIQTDQVDNSDQRNTTQALVKIGLYIVFLCGVLMRIFSPFETFTHLADVLMMIGVLGRLFMYVKALTPSLFLPKAHDSSPLTLVEKKEAAISTYDQRTRTPLERVISDK